MNKAAATLVISAFLVVSTGTGLAQNPAPQSAAPQGAPAQTTAQNAAARAATLSRPTGRFGRTLGLPKDGKDRLCIGSTWSWSSCLRIEGCRATIG